jgi:ATP/maltotriose-dependent transcriptional regulator MalT
MGMFFIGLFTGWVSLMGLRVLLFRLNKKAEEYKKIMDVDKDLLTDYLNIKDNG